MQRRMNDRGRWFGDFGGPVRPALRRGIQARALIGRDSTSSREGNSEAALAPAWSIVENTALPTIAAGSCEAGRRSPFSRAG